jgi:parallel beta-helix repeat protein
MRRIRHPLTMSLHLPAPGAVSVTLLAAALACWLAMGGTQASAARVNCGDTITVDTTLHQSLVNCPNNGIVIGANGVTLNLNGHRIDGDGTPAAGCDLQTEFCDIGVVNDGHDGVTVRHGSVREFGFGVFVGRARHNRVLRISSSRNLSFGFFIARSARSLVHRSSSHDNVAPEGDGMGLFFSHRIRIRHSSFRRNPGPGIHVADSTGNLIKGNAFSRNGPGILMEADRNRVRRNRLIRGAGFLVGTGSRNVIARNHVSRAVDSIAIEKGRGNLVAHNVVVRARGAGIRLGIEHPFIGGAHNVVRRNRVRRSGGDGFLVVGKDRHSLLRRNIAVGARDDGFDIASRSATLTRNRAANNGDLGIEAVLGVNDGGGNRAHGNGNPLQCVNVVCG